MSEICRSGQQTGNSGETGCYSPELTLQRAAGWNLRQEFYIAVSGLNFFLSKKFCS